jgi:hypothetical protein
MEVVVKEVEVVVKEVEVVVKEVEETIPLLPLRGPLIAKIAIGRPQD